MIEAKSGIVLYPEGEVQPNIARQLGIVFADQNQSGEIETQTVHAIPYKQDVAIEGCELYYPNGAKMFRPPFYDKVRESKIEQVRKGILTTVASYLEDQGITGSIDQVIGRRRMDVVAPIDVPHNAFAMNSLFYMINDSARTASPFVQSTHPWVKTRNRGYAPVQNVLTDTFYDIGDPRRRLSLSEASREVFATDVTLEPQVLEILSGYEPTTKAEILDFDGIQTISKMDIYARRDYNHPLPVSNEIKKKILELRDRFNNIDYNNWVQYQEDYGDGEGDMFGDYQPKPVDRTELVNVTKSIDPIDNEEWRSRLS